MEEIHNTTQSIKSDLLAAGIDNDYIESIKILAQVTDRCANFINNGIKR